MMRIDLIAPQRGRYGALNRFTEDLCEALKRKGASCRLLRPEGRDPGPFLEELYNDRPDCTLSFNGLLPDAEGRFLCELIKIPHVAYTVDSPSQFFLLARSPLTVITCVDGFACDYFKQLQAKNVLFLPHGVDRDLQPEPNLERSYDVVMLSSCIDFEHIRDMWKEKYRIPLCAALDEAAEITLSEDNIPCEEAIAQAINTRISQGIDPRKINFTELLQDLEDYVRGKDRVELVRAIQDAQIHLFGESDQTAGWSKYCANQSNVVIHDSLPYEENLEIMKQSKIVLNSCVWMKNGSHERIFAGLACGALVLTHENLFMSDHFKDGESIAFYHSTKSAHANDVINHYLSNELERQRVAAKGREITMHKHTWDHRAATLLEALPSILERMQNETSF